MFFLLVVWGLEAATCPSWQGLGWETTCCDCGRFRKLQDSSAPGSNHTCNSELGLQGGESTRRCFISWTDNHVFLEDLFNKYVSQQRNNLTRHALESEPQVNQVNQTWITLKRLLPPKNGLKASAQDYVAACRTFRQVCRTCLILTLCAVRSQRSQSHGSKKTQKGMVTLFVFRVFLPETLSCLSKNYFVVKNTTGFIIGDSKVVSKEICGFVGFNSSSRPSMEFLQSLFQCLQFFSWWFLCIRATVGGFLVDESGERAMGWMALMISIA